MANIQSNLNKIKNAVLGIEVRDSIHDAIKQCYDDASAKDNANMEVKMARGEYENLGKRLDSHSSQIKDKADKDEVFSLANMGQDIKEAMTGGSVAVVGRNAILEENIVDGQIKPYKLDAYSNIIDKNDVITNKAINTTTFEVVDYDGYSVTDFIPISIGKYIINFYSYDTIFIYDENKNKIKYINTTTNTTIFNIEQNGYVRFCIPTNSLETAMCIKGDTLPQEYIPYGFVKWLKLKNNNFTDKCVPNNSLNFDYKFIEKWKKEIVRMNLFDKNEIIEGKILTYPSGTLESNSDFFVSDFIEVNEGYYTLNIANYDTVFLYDNNKLLIDKISLTGYGIVTNTISISSSVSYIKLSCLLAYKDEIMFVKGETLPNCYYSYNNFSIPNLIINEKTLNGTYLFSGDSICYGAGSTGGYASFIAKSNPNAIIKNYGISGTTIAKRTGQSDSILERIDDMQDDADFVIFEGGVNDAWSSLVGLGDFDDISFNTTNYINNLDEYSFSGALESLFNKAQNKWLGKKIFFIIPHNMDLQNTKAYMDRAEEICKKWGVILIDLRKLSGLNTNNDYMKTTYTNNGDGVHPNSSGYEEFYVKPIVDILMKYN